MVLDANNVLFRKALLQFESHPCSAAIAPTHGQQGCKEVFVVESYA
jgi:hypothetical protein